MPEYNAQKRKRGLLTEQTDGGENRAARLAAEKKSVVPSARVPDVWQAPRERDRDPFRVNVEEAAAAHRRLGEIADARRDAQDNPTKFHNIKQQKDFLAYLDEEETGARARESEMLAENFRILQNQGQNGSKMLYNTSSARVLEQETVDRMASVIRAGLEANGILPASSGKPATSGSPEWEIAPNARRTGASGTVDAAKHLASAAPAKANRALPTDHSDGEEEDAARLGETIWGFIQRLFGGRDKPSATPAPTPTPQTVTLYPQTTPATVSFYTKTTPSPTPPPWPTPTPVPMGEQIVEKAKSLTGLPYKLSGRVEEGTIDCSGLVKWACEEIGSALKFGPGHIGYSADGMAKSMEKDPELGETVWKADAGVPLNLNELEWGDLIFLKKPDEEKYAHVALYAGEGMTIEASSEFHEVGLRDVFDEYEDGSYTRKNGQEVYLIIRPNY